MLLSVPSDTARSAETCDSIGRDPREARVGSGRIVRVSARRLSERRCSRLCDCRERRRVPGRADGGRVGPARNGGRLSAKKLMWLR